MDSWAYNFRGLDVMAINPATNECTGTDALASFWASSTAIFSLACSPTFTRRYGCDLVSKMWRDTQDFALSQLIAFYRVIRVVDHRSFIRNFGGKRCSYSATTPIHNHRTYDVGGFSGIGIIVRRLSIS